MKRCYHHVTDPLTMRLILRNLPHRGAAVITPVGSDKAWLVHKSCAAHHEVAPDFLENIFYPTDVQHVFEVTELTMFERKQHAADAICSICRAPLRNTSGYDDREDPQLELATQ